MIPSHTGYHPKHSEGWIALGVILCGERATSVVVYERGGGRATKAAAVTLQQGKFLGAHLEQPPRSILMQGAMEQRCGFCPMLS